MCYLNFLSYVMPEFKQANALIESLNETIGSEFSYELVKLRRNNKVIRYILICSKMSHRIFS
jgi:hypothetical protein